MVACRKNGKKKSFRRPVTAAYYNISLQILVEQDRRRANGPPCMWCCCATSVCVWEPENFIISDARTVDQVFRYYNRRRNRVHILYFITTFTRVARRRIDFGSDTPSFRFGWATFVRINYYYYSTRYYSEKRWWENARFLYSSVKKEKEILCGNFDCLY